MLSWPRPALGGPQWPLTYGSTTPVFVPILTCLPLCDFLRPLPSACVCLWDSSPPATGPLVIGFRATPPQGDPPQPDHICKKTISKQDHSPRNLG